jgi:DNA polymerase
VTRDQIKAHLEFFGELGVDGVRLEPEWRTRPHATELERGNSELRNSELGTSEPGNSELGNSHEHVGVFTSQADALKALRTEIGPDCSRCKLHTLGRKQVVFGVGNPNADLMFVGEAPGADEDIQGEPFVGRAGQLLTKIIEAIGLTRDSVYIANVIKCRPPGNRNPEPDEVDTCEPFLFRQLDIIKPANSPRSRCSGRATRLRASADASTSTATPS